MTTPDPLQDGSVDWGDLSVGLVWVRTEDSVAICTGTLIAADIVLTAAHCLASPVDSFYLGVGSPREGYLVDAQLAYPDWTGDCASQAADIGLLHLAKPVNGIALSSLADAAPELAASCTAIGFGTHQGSDGATTVGLERAGLELVTAISDGRISTRAESTIVNHGDSGGPLPCDGQIAGVVSCANAATGHALYARVDVVNAWIGQTIDALRAAAR